MNLTIDTQNKTILVNENVSIDELIKFLKENLKDYKEYSISSNQGSWINQFPVYPSYPVFPSYPIITYDTNGVIIMNY